MLSPVSEERSFDTLRTGLGAAAKAKALAGARLIDGVLSQGASLAGVMWRAASLSRRSLG